MNLTIIIAAVSAAFAGSVGFGAAWTLQGRSIDELKLGAANERIAQQRAARQVAERLAGQVAQAQSDAAARNVGLRSDAAAASNAAGGLRVASNSATRAAHTSADTCGRVVDAYGIILDEGREVIREMASDLDRCYSERQTLSEAWPTNQPRSLRLSF